MKLLLGVSYVHRWCWPSSVSGSLPVVPGHQWAAIWSLSRRYMDLGWIQTTPWRRRDDFRLMKFPSISSIHPERGRGLHFFGPGDTVPHNCWKTWSEGLDWRKLMSKWEILVQQETELHNNLKSTVFIYVLFVCHYRYTWAFILESRYLHAS